MTELRVKFANKGPFTDELKQSVRNYLDRPGIRNRAYRQIQIKAVVIGLWALASYSALLLVADNWWQVAVTGLSLALSLNAVGFCIMHDGNHGGFSSRPKLNRAMGYTLDLLGGSSYVWRVKHNIAHHTFPNVEKHDEDIQLDPLGRMSSTDEWKWYHRYQKIYLFFFYGFMSIRWQLVNDVRTLRRGKVGESRIAMPKGWDMFGLVAGKAVFVTWIAVLPLATHWSWHGALMVLVTFVGLSWVFSFVLALTFQMAHCVDEAYFAPISDADESGKMPVPWFVHQVLTTADFCPKDLQTSSIGPVSNWFNGAITWFVGGLNYQLEHHLFANETHIHYPAIAKIVRAKCAEYNLPYMCQPTLVRAVRAHYRHLKNMGIPPQTATA